MTYTKKERAKYQRNYRKGIKKKSKKKTKKELNAVEKFEKWRKNRECSYCHEIYARKDRETKWCQFCLRVDGKEIKKYEKETKD